MKKIFFTGMVIAAFVNLPLAIANQDSPSIINSLGESQKTVQIQGISGESLGYAIQTQNRHHYTVCIAPTAGDPDLYGRLMHDGVIFAVESSANRGIWIGQGVPRRDCITFESEVSGVIEVTINVVEDFAGDLYFVGTPYDDVPAGFEEALISPLDNLQLTSPKWGPFGSPWGNDLPEHEPFSDIDHDGFLHGGTDMAAPSGTPVKAACSGLIRRNGMLDDDMPSKWGGYTILECVSPVNGAIITLAYDHLKPESVLSVGTVVNQGDIIGQVYTMLMPGEEDHLHFTICKEGNYDSCAAVSQQPQRGSLHYEDFPGVWIESDPRKNTGLFKP